MNTDLKYGLSEAEAARRIQEEGFNELPSAAPKNIGTIALEVIREPMFILLVACGSLYLILGDYSEGLILLSATSLIILITFFQYRKTERALEALRALSSPRAKVIREGKEFVVAGKDVVRGDLIIIHEGDRVPADGIVIESLHLHVDEAILTGESVPVDKFSTEEINTSVADTSKVFSGTLVAGGTAKVIVTHTGTKTRFGAIGGSLSSIETSETRLQSEMKKFIRNVAVIGILICAAVVALFYLTRNDFLQALLSGLSAAMAILPEEFPVVMTVFLALGAWRLSKSNVLTRKPSAIETLGSATVLCSDKTGTITMNKMAVAAIYDGRNIIETFTEETGTIMKVIEHGAMASRKDSFDPMEKAILSLSAEKNGVSPAASQFMKEYPLSRELFAMSRAFREADGTYRIYCKGAPEAVFRLCHLSPQETETHQLAVTRMAERGLRILGVCCATYNLNELPERQENFEFSFEGLIGLEDPVRPEVPAAIKECMSAGVKVIMITGDYPVTARSIGRKIGLGENCKIITGSELEQMTDEALAKCINEVSIFARVIPEQKLRIVRALKTDGHVVAMTGDGVNDAPALKAADIGIAMGQKGTDVAREASSLVLLDDNFASIVSAIHLGRRIFDNMQKAMSYILAIHMPIIGLAIIPAVFEWLPILLLPLHIVFMELIIDPVCSVAFESEKDEKGVMTRPPRNPDTRFFGPSQILFAVFKGLLLLAMVLGVYLLTINEGHTDHEVRAIAFNALIFGNIVLIYTSLSKTRTAFSVLLEGNKALLLITVLALSILYSVTHIPGLKQLFSFSNPGNEHFIVSGIGALALLIVLEILKWLGIKLQKKASDTVIR
ncbi:MAG: HAD-IC family P-type ATPase [Bacteroidia bacterium]